MSDLREKLIEQFKDKEFRQVYCEEFLNTAIATQIKVLREERGLSQKQLAAMLGTTQPAISAHESPEKESWSIKILHKFAAAFDLALVVRFESFGADLDDIVSFSRDHLKRPSFKDDPTFHKTSPKAVSSEVVDIREFIERRAEGGTSLKRTAASQNATISITPELEEDYG
jgi:transcriptional regulator with XRE-family HTH domain